MEYFGEEPVIWENTNLCCDVRAFSQDTVNCLPEIEVIIQAVDELPSSGEKKERSNAIMCLPSYEIYNNCTLIRLPSGFVVQGISKLSSYVTHLCRPLGVEVN